MKKIILSMVISTYLLGGIAVAGEALPLVYVKDSSGSWTVSGFDSGAAYAAAQVTTINEEREKRLKDVESSGKTGSEQEVLRNNINREFDAVGKRFISYGEEAEIALKLIKNGTPISIAQNEASDQYQAANSGFKDVYDKNDPSTSYNSGSVTSSIISGEEAPLISNNQFKQFNELDCSYEEVANYVDRTKDTKTKAYSSSPSFSNTFKKTASKSAKSLKTEDEQSCQTIFDDVDFTKLPSFSMPSMSSGLPSFDGDMLNDLGNKAADQIGALTNDLLAVLQEGVCARLTSDYVGDLAGDIINDEYKDNTKDTALEGTKINKLDSESGQNNFTYKVIKNQSEVSDSNLIKGIDVTRDDQAKNQEKYMEGELDDVLDDLEEEIFG